MFEVLTEKIKRLVLAERSCTKVASSVCLGTFIALTPTIPFQTPLLFILSWLFRLNAGIVFALVYIVNNPFTMIPIYVAGYAVGVWFFESLLHISLVQYNPAFVMWINEKISGYIDLKKYLGSEFCLWYLLIGGFLFAGAISMLLYPFVKAICQRMLKKQEKLNESHLTK